MVNLHVEVLSVKLGEESAIVSLAHEDRQVLWGIFEIGSIVFH